MARRRVKLGEDEVERKRTGRFYTPKPLADFLVKWAIRSPTDRVLDPSCGGGVFIEAAFDRLLELGAAKEQLSQQVVGIDIDYLELARLMGSLKERYRIERPQIIDIDFFQVDRARRRFGAVETSEFDAIVGNPPYIRYHHFRGEVRERALAVARKQDVVLSGLTSSWAPFVVHAVSLLSPSGRLAMVLPGELLSVDYAAPVRRFLCHQFGDINIIAFDRRVFPTALEDTVLFLGEKVGAHGMLRLSRVVDGELPLKIGPAAQTTQVPLQIASTLQKWTLLLLPSSLLHLVEEAINHPSLRKLGDFGRVDIGVVTGRNDFFILRPSVAERYGIEREFLTPIISSSRVLSGLDFNPNDFSRLESQDEPIFLIDIGSYGGDIRKTSLWSYLEKADEDTKRAFKVRTRWPWYTVPSTYVPTGFLTYMAGAIPKLVLNSAGVTCTNTVHRFVAETNANPKHMVLSFYNSLTMLSAEVVGRSYGGGVLKLETKEGEKVVLPELQSEYVLHRLWKSVDHALRKGDYEQAIRLVDEEMQTVMPGGMGIEPIQEAWRTMRARRLARMSK